jgi:trehalose 6-phosphate synthase
MRSFAVRLIAAIWVVSLVVIAAFTWQQTVEERRRLTRELTQRAALVGDALREAVEPPLQRGQTARVERLVRSFSRAGQGIAVFDRLAAPIVSSGPLAAALPAAPHEVVRAIATGAAQQGYARVDDRTIYVYASPVSAEDRPAGAVAVFLDAVHIGRAEWDLWRLGAVRFFVLAAVLSALAAVMVRMSITRPLADLAGWARTLRRGAAPPPLALAERSLFGDMAQEISALARSLARARAAAEAEAALRLAGESLWTEERLKQFVRLRLGDRPVVVVSNREPLSHVRRDGRVIVQTPASGLVAAMEPVMRACEGVWVAHGSGDADREHADARGRLLVPPDDPRYTLRRVWLTPEEEAGYYYGFANEGLWPLCHIVHTRPRFRPEDWAHYRAVNERFGATVLDEVEKQAAPLILVQDYHFALLPALVKQARPDARVAIFWHIPWPNFEAFGICPWQGELLHGMLGADLIGFHTQYYCNNFLGTAERVVEARVDWEHFAVTRGAHTTYVKPFPISVAPNFLEDPPDVGRAELLASLGISAEFLGVGVERLDYTKGIPERIRALGRFFERFPEYAERLVFVQLAAPSRSSIVRYQEIEAEVDEAVRAVNAAHQTRRWRPVLYLKRHHEHREVWPFFRHADFCMVTSLHDGMNLVAKEFISVRDDLDGVLVLSQFAGASAELPDALLVNPYDIDAVAEAIRRALTMPAEERRARMGRMHRQVREQNIYRWAGRLINELVRLPEAPAEPAAVRADAAG